MKQIHDATGIAWPLRAAMVGTAFAVAMVMSVTGVAQAQSAPIIYPSQGQTLAQQGQDENDCRIWAQQQTGFNPSQGPVYYSSPSGGGQVVRGAAGGAMIGVIGGAIGGDAGKGAAIGAGVGAAAGLLRRGRQQRAQEQAQQQAIDQYNQQLANYNRAFAACMQGRGYAVN
jgi:hypothetical protein